MTHDTKATRLADKAKRLADSYANASMAIFAIAKPEAERTKLHATIDALRGLAIPAGEAVAWRVSHPVSGDIFRDTEPDSGVYPPSYTVTPLYASPQPTPEASQDGGGAACKFDACPCEPSCQRGECQHPALRSPLPGRESTAQAGAATESSSERSSGCLNSSGLAQTLTSETTSPSVLAMREALQRIADMRDRDGNAIEMHREELRGIARAALAALPEEREETLSEFVAAMRAIDGSGWNECEDAQAELRKLREDDPALPEPRAGETEPEPPAGCACVLTLSEGMLDAAIRALMWAPTEGNRTRLRGGLEAALAAATPSPIATPTRPTLTQRLQQKCSDWNTYWRAPDAHGVNLSVEEATELLADALGVEVAIATPKPQEREPLTEDVLRDAARYRFIRDADRSDFNGTSFDTIMRYAMEDLDILVDEAIERERAHGIVPQDGDRGEGEGAEIARAEPWLRSSEVRERLKDGK